MLTAYLHCCQAREARASWICPISKCNLEKLWEIQGNVRSNRCSEDEESRYRAGALIFFFASNSADSQELRLLQDGRLSQTGQMSARAQWKKQEPPARPRRHKNNDNYVTQKINDWRKYAFHYVKLSYACKFLHDRLGCCSCFQAVSYVESACSVEFELWLVIVNYKHLQIRAWKGE